MTHGATRGTNAAELAAHPPRRRGIAAMEAEGWPPEPDVEWRFRSSSDSDCVLGDAPAALADDSDADADVRLGAATAGRRLDLGAADETQRLGVPADADTDGGDGPGGVALGVGVDTDTDHDGGGLGGVGADSDLENPGGEGGTGLPGTAWRCGGVAAGTLAPRAGWVAPSGADARHQGLGGSAALAAAMSPGSGGCIGNSAAPHPILGCPGRVRLDRVGTVAHLADVLRSSR